MSRTELRTEVFNYLSPLMDDEQAMQQVIVFLRSIQPTAPCGYTQTEMQSRLNKAEADINLNLGQTWQEVMTEAQSW